MIIMNFDSNFDKNFLQIPKTVFPKVLSEDIDVLLSSGSFYIPFIKLIQVRAESLGIKVVGSSQFYRSADKFKVTFEDNTVYVNSGLRSEFIPTYLSIGVSILSAFKSDAMALLTPSKEYTWGIGLGNFINYMVPHQDEYRKDDDDIPRRFEHAFSKGVTHISAWGTKDWKKNAGSLDPVTGSPLLPILEPLIKHSISESFSGVPGATLQLLISDTEFWRNRGDLRREFISLYFRLPITYVDIVLWHLHKIHRYPHYSTDIKVYTGDFHAEE